MLIPKEEKRIYRYKDADAIEKLYYIHTCFMHDRSNFEDFHTKFTEQFGNDFLEKIQIAQNAPQDDQLIDILAQKTQVVNDVMTEIQESFYRMRYFLKEAFKNKPHILNEFGLNDYAKARNSQKEMQEFMATLVSASNKYKTELNGAGFSQADIDKLQTYYDDLVAANNDQEYYKGERRTLNQQRIILINDAWAIAVDICDAGKIIFTDNYAKYKQYVLYESTSGNGSHTYNGNVPPSQTVVILSEGFAPETGLVLGNNGQTVLKYCVGEDESPCASGKDVDPGEEVVTTVSELGTGTILKATNLSDTVEGIFEVEVG